MADKNTERDGTSQAGRVLAALDPGYAGIDERGIADLVAFAHELGKALRYHGEDGTIGDWSGFVDSLDPAAVAEFLNAPENFDPASSPALFRPHFVLFLAFLGLFKEAQARLNALTGRHLDFYYRQVLRIVEKGPISDRLNLVFDLAKDTSEVMVPAGSLLSAGPDSLGKDRVYPTERNLVVNRAQIGKVSSVFVKRRITGFAKARALGQKDGENTCLEMFRIAIGDPSPGDPLPPYDQGKSQVSFSLLTQLDARTQDTQKDRGFYLSLSEIRDLMLLVDLKLDTATGIESILALSLKRQKDLGVSDANEPDLAALGAYWGEIQTLENYFFMTAENFHQVMQQFQQQVLNLDDENWLRVDGILDAAHKQKIREQRIAELRQIHASAPAGGLLPLIQAALDNYNATNEDLATVLAQPEREMLEQSADKGDWERVCSILEVVLRNRLGEPPAQHEEWLNIYPAADSAVAGARATADDKETPRWAMFGLPQASDENSPPAPVIGWAVSSPTLSLAEGDRTIALTLGVCADGLDAEKLQEFDTLLTSNPPPLVFQVSTANGWVECHTAKVSTAPSYNDLRGTTYPSKPVGLAFELNLPASVDPVVPLPVALSGMDSPWPALRAMLPPIWSKPKGTSDSEGEYVLRYRELRDLRLVAVHLQVKVTGLNSLEFFNDEKALDAKKPFEPFGLAPAVGSHLFIKHPEIVNKKLDSLTFKFQWMNTPSNLGAHYANYGLQNNGAFAAAVALIDRSERKMLIENAALFGLATSPTSDEKVISVAPVPAPVEAVGADSDRATPVADSKSAATWRRYFQWELLSPDFQHSAYPALAAGKAVELACAIATKATTLAAGDYKVNPPYTPKLKYLTIDYESSVEASLGAEAIAPSTARIFHVHPFGACEIEADRKPDGLPLLPSYDDAGELYLGLRDVFPPQNVSILFQLAEGTANPSLDPEPVKWSCLDGNCWVPLDDSIVFDSTEGLTSSGIIEIALGQVKPSTRLPDGLYWLRATVAHNTGVVCDAIGLPCTQAVAATFRNQGNAKDHFREPLPVGTVSKLASAIPGIAGVRQPSTSYGGRMAEDSAMWATRVSERIRHKQRALSTWDYERLVLECFPEVYKARCIPASPDRPGMVEMVVIPDVRKLLPSDPFAPKAPARLLRQVQEYLATLAPAFASVRVRNAEYVSVQVRLYVRFVTGADEAYHANLLNDQLNRFLSPWAYDDAADIALGGRIYANSIVNFVDRRDYVDFVAGVKLWSSSEGGSFLPVPPPPTGEGELVEAGSPYAVLAAARTHAILVVHDAQFDERLLTGVNFMKIGFDFIVA